MRQIELTDSEIRQVALVAADRVITSKNLGYKNKHGFDGKSRWDIDINGAAAELAYAKMRKEYWKASTGTNQDVDHNENVEIRWTSHQGGKLILRPGDNPESYFVLVVDPAPVMRVVGWIKGLDGMIDQYKTDFGVSGRPEVWAVPQSDLKGF